MAGFCFQGGAEEFSVLFILVRPVDKARLLLLSDPEDRRGLLGPPLHRAGLRPQPPAFSCFLYSGAEDGGRPSHLDSFGDQRGQQHGGGMVELKGTSLNPLSKIQCSFSF